MLHRHAHTDRKSLRPAGHGYHDTEGYFVTLCTRHRRPFFGDGVRGSVALNGVGQCAERCLAAIPAIYPHVRLGAWVVMPQHIHFIVWMDRTWIRQAAEAGHRPGRPPASLGMIVNQFKGAVSKAATSDHGVAAGALWQRGYYEHVIRDRREPFIRRYIENHRISPSAMARSPTVDLRLQPWSRPRPWSRPGSRPQAADVRSRPQAADVRSRP